MNTNGIPATFWHALSIAVIAFTAILCYIAVRANSVSIKYKDAQIDLLRVDEQKQEVVQSAEAIAEEAKKVSSAAEALESEKKTVEEQRKQLTEVARQISENPRSASTPEVQSSLDKALKTKPRVSIPSVDIEKIESAKKRLELPKRVLVPRDTSTAPSQ